MKDDEHARGGVGYNDCSTTTGRIDLMKANKSLATTIQETIDKGATTAEEIHKSIAGLPLKVLEEADLLKGPVKEVRRFQEHAIGAVYDLIRGVNGQVGKLASDLLSGATDASRPAAGPQAKRAAGHAGKSH